MNASTPADRDSSPPPEAAIAGRLEFLDGVRGLAALYVVAHHLWRAYTDEALPGLAGICTNWLLYGHLGVDVFIVLSGFCLMLPVARARALGGGWRRFYLRRVRRILPPLYVTILLSIALQAVHSPPSPAAVAANLLLVQDVWQSQNTINAPLWSVALECKIYSLFPVLVWLWLRYGPAVVCFAAAVASAMLYAVFAQVPAVLSQTHCCSWYVLLFALGMVAAEFAVADTSDAPAVRWRLSALMAGSLLCLVAALFLWPITPEDGAASFAPHLPLIDTALGVFSASLFVALGRKAVTKEKSRMVALLSWRPLVFVGSIGYSLYLIHADLVYAIRNRLVEHLRFHPAFVVIPVDMAIVVAIAYFFHLAFERPFMSRPAPGSGPQAAAAAVANPAP